MERKVRKAPYHITITDNRTAEIIVDHDAEAIIGGTSKGTDGYKFAAIDTNAAMVIVAAAEAEKAVEEATKEIPRAKRFLRKTMAEIKRITDKEEQK